MLYELMVEAMRAKALELEITGAGGALLLKKEDLPDNMLTPVVFVVQDFARGPKNGDTGANYLAVAASKLAEMLDTFSDSGSNEKRPVKKGEWGYRGGIIRQLDEDFYIALFFSGGTADQDVEVATAGYEALMEELNSPPVIVATLYVSSAFFDEE